MEALRLPTGARGYRMREVDDVLDRLGAELAERDARIAELQSALAGAQAAARGDGELFGEQGDRAMSADDGSLPGADGRLRCPWGLSAEDYTAYHDTEWGRPVHGDDALFERLCLEAFQSGLSWLTILRRREGFRAAFAGFRIAEVARFTDADEERLLADARHHPQPRQDPVRLWPTRRWPPQWGEGELDALVWSHAPDCRGTPRAPHARRRPRRHSGVDGAGQGAEEARLPLRRPDDRLRADAGLRPGRRPPRRLLRTRRGDASGSRSFKRRCSAASPSSRTRRPRPGGRGRSRPAPADRPPSPASRPASGRRRRPATP